MLLRRTLLAAAATTALALSAMPTAAQTTLKIGWTTSDGETDPYAIAAREFATALEEVAPGRFETSFFPNRQLGDEKEMLEGLGFGTLDVAVITNAVIANVQPSFQLNDMPFLYADAAQAHEILDGEIGEQLLASLEENGVVGLGFAEGGFRHMINNAKPVSKPDDVEGVKYRVMQNPVFIEMFQSLGGNAVPMAWGETFTAVQQGTVDGLEIPVAVVRNNNYSDVVRYLSMTGHTYSALGLLIAKRTFEGLSAEDQEAVRKAADLAIERQREQVAKNVDQMVSDLEAAGMQVNRVEDPGAFRAKVKPVYDRFRGEIGGDLMDRALKAVE